MDSFMTTKRVDALTEHPRNKEFFDDISGVKWEQFLESVRTSGVIEPIVVTENGVIVSGHQRVRACKALGIETVKAKVCSYTDADAILKDLLETNVRQRGVIDGTPSQIMKIGLELERLYGVKHGGDRGNQYTGGKSANCTFDNQADIADMMGLSVDQWKRYKRLQNLSPELLQVVDAGRISVNTAVSAIARMDAEEQRALLEQIASLPESQRITQKLYAEMEEDIRSHLGRQMDTLSRQIEEQARQIDDLKNREPIVKTVEVKPDDYDRIKRELVDELQEHQRLQRENSRMTMELHRYEERERESPEGSYKRKFEADTVFLHSECNAFLAKVAPYLYVVNEPENIKPERMMMIAKAIIAIDGWAQNMFEVMRGNAQWENALNKGGS